MVCHHLGHFTSLQPATTTAITQAPSLSSLDHHHLLMTMTTSLQKEGFFKNFDNVAMSQLLTNKKKPKRCQSLGPIDNDVG